VPAIALAKTGWTEATLTVALKNRYAGSAYAFLPQVANGTGGNKSRTADALVMSLWPSRGLDLIGFEIKRTRQDWLNELRRPEKADSIAKYCDQWYLVIAAESIVQPGELPGAWGLMAPKGKVLRIIKEAKQLETKPLSRTFLAALLRNAAGAIVPKAEIEEELRRATEEGKRSAEESARWKWERGSRELAQLQESLRKFEAASGLRISEYNGEQLGKAVALVKTQGVDRITTDLTRLKSIAQEVVTRVDVGLQEFEQNGHSGK
jgi:hypothetical protein